MIRKIKVHVISESSGENHVPNNDYTMRWIGDNVIGSNFENAEIVVFTGGADIHPKYYNQEPLANLWLSHGNRDEYEFEMYKRAVEKNKIMVGICRGCQLLTIGNGGSLIQDVKNHFSTHWVYCTLDKTFKTTNSVHHQMCWPYDLNKEDYQILAFSNQRMFKKDTVFSYITEGTVQKTVNNVPLKNLVDFAEPEMIYYPKTLSIGIQGHPESLEKTNPYLKYVTSFIQEVVKNKRIIDKMETYDFQNQLIIT